MKQNRKESRSASLPHDVVAFVQGHTSFVFAFHERDEIGPRVLARISKHTGLKPEDL